MSTEPPNADRAAQIAALLAAPLPRTVPADLRRAALQQCAPVALALLGSVFVLFGAFFAYFFFPWNFYRELRLSAADTAMAAGRVVSTALTNMSVKKTPVVSCQFEFQPSPAARVRGECYTTGGRWRAGDAVTVRYRPEDPAVCCIVGARLNPAGSTGGVLLLFPVIGGGFIAWVVVARRRQAWLLENGFLAEALVTAVEQTPMTANKRFVHKITLQRTDSPDGGNFVVKQTAPDAIAFARARMAANQPVFVLYDPAHLKRAMLPETL